MSLALSLHAPTQESRSDIVPAAKGFKLPDLVAAMDAYIATNRRLLIEYVLLAGVNDTDQRAHELGALLKGKNVLVNLIPYNNTDVNAPFQPPSPDEVQRFQRIVYTDYGLVTTIRKEMGGDVAGACGQLVVKKEKMAASVKGNAKVRDIEDMVAPAAKQVPLEKQEEAELVTWDGVRTLWPDVSLKNNKRYQKRHPTQSSNSSLSSSPSPSSLLGGQHFPSYKQTIMTMLQFLFIAALAFFLGRISSEPVFA